MLENKYDILNDGFINFEEFVKNLNLEDSKISEINKNKSNTLNHQNKNIKDNIINKTNKIQIENKDVKFDGITKYEYDGMIN